MTTLQLINYIATNASEIDQVLMREQTRTPMEAIAYLTAHYAKAFNRWHWAITHTGGILKANMDAIINGQAKYPCRVTIVQDETKTMILTTPGGVNIHICGESGGILGLVAKRIYNEFKTDHPEAGMLTEGEIKLFYNGQSKTDAYHGSYDKF